LGSIKTGGLINDDVIKASPSCYLNLASHSFVLLVFDVAMLLDVQAPEKLLHYLFDP
jgi:hypothetical protein